MIRTTRRWRLVAAAAAVGLTLAACGTTDDSDGESSGGGDGDCTPQKIAFLGALTGPYAALGINAINGVELAIDQYNEKNPDCTVELVKADSGADPEKATNLAKSLIDDDEVIGLVGPLFSGESAAADPLFDEAGLPMITASATNPTLSEQGWTTFHRLLGNDAVQGPAVAVALTDVVEAEKVFVIDDTTEYGKGLGDAVKEALGDKVIGSDVLQPGKRSFPTQVEKVNASGADTLVFGGYYPEAGPLVKQVKATGWDGTFVAGDGVKDPEFVKVGGKAAEGSILTCPCVPGETITDFYEAYTAAYSVDPGTYSPEGFDAANVFLAGITDGITDREEMNDFVTNYDEAGITKQISFDENGESNEIPMWAYRVTDGEITKVQELQVQ